MTVDIIISRVQYAGDGSTTVRAYPFKIYDDDDSLMGKLLRKMQRETFSLVQSLDPDMFIELPRVLSWVKQLSVHLKQLLFLEEYKTKPGLKGAKGLQRQLTPRAIKQFQGKAKKPGQR